MHDLILIIKEWQTLLGSLIALIAAFLTVRVMKQQMNQDELRQRGFAERRKMAMRSKMPDALSELHRYVETVALAILEDGELPDGQPTSALEVLKETIEFIDEHAAERCFELVSFYQVWSARIHNPKRRNRMINYKEMGLVDSAKLRRYISSLFPYARNEVQDEPFEEPSRSELFESLVSMIGIERRDRHKAFLETLEHRYI